MCISADACSEAVEKVHLRSKWQIREADRMKRREDFLGQMQSIAMHSLLKRVPVVGSSEVVKDCLSFQHTKMRKLAAVTGQDDGEVMRVVMV